MTRTTVLPEGVYGVELHAKMSHSTFGQHSYILRSGKRLLTTNAPERAPSGQGRGCSFTSQLNKPEVCQTVLCPIYRLIEVGASTAKIHPVSTPGSESILVALNGLCGCLDEISNEFWTI